MIYLCSAKFKTARHVGVINNNNILLYTPRLKHKRQCKEHSQGGGDHRNKLKILGLLHKGSSGFFEKNERRVLKQGIIRLNKKDRQV